MIGTDDAGALLETTSFRHPWPTAPFPPPPDPSTARTGLLRLDAVGPSAIRVRHVVGGDLRDGGGSMIVGSLDPSGAAVETDGGTVRVRSPRALATIHLDPFSLELREVTTSRATRIGGPDRSYFAVGDSVGTGVNVDTEDGRRVATETFAIAPGTTVHGFGESFVGFDKVGQTLDVDVRDAMGVNTPRMYKPVPFFATTGGYGVFVHTTRRRRSGSGRGPRTRCRSRSTTTCSTTSSSSDRSARCPGTTRR